MKRLLWVGILAVILSGCAVERTVYLRQDGTTERVVTTPVPIVVETTPVMYYEPYYEPSPIIWVDIHGSRHYRGHYGRHGRGHR